tara:strand:+ start:255 stop:503 length:249 start_codon:yes stop_codon:yes gene_type:complete
MKNEKKEILEKIQPVFSKVFGNESIKIDHNSSPETIEQWDSLAQINLIIGIEKLMKIKFSVTELASLKNVGEIIDLILTKKK